jgi:hypothetical protein
MLEEYVQKALEIAKEYNRITAPLLMRKLKITGEFAQKVCHQVWLIQRKEAMEAASELDNYGFNPQMQCKARRKNLEKFKKNKGM